MVQIVPRRKRTILANNERTMRRELMGTRAAWSKRTVNATHIRVTSPRLAPFMSHAVTIQFKRYADAMTFYRWMLALRWPK